MCIFSGSLFAYDDNIAFWTFCAAGNYAARFYRYAMPMVSALQRSLMSQSLKRTAEVEQRVLELLNRSSVLNGVFTAEAEAMARGLLSAVTVEQGVQITKAYRDLLPRLITTFHDGYRATDLSGANINMQKLFYSKSWLEATGYWDQSHLPNKGDDVILFSANDFGDSGHSVVLTLALMLLSGLIASALTVLALSRKSPAEAADISVDGESKQQRTSHRTFSSPSAVVRSVLEMTKHTSSSSNKYRYERIADHDVANNL